MKLKELYKKYINYIVIFLLLMVFFKSCQSCTSNRRTEFDRQNYVYQLDSLHKCIEGLNYEIKILKDSISNYEYKLNILNNENERLNDLNNHFKMTNKTLINTNNDLLNKNIIE